MVSLPSIHDLFPQFIDPPNYSFAVYKSNPHSLDRLSSTTSPPPPRPRTATSQSTTTTTTTAPPTPGQDKGSGGKIHECPLCFKRFNRPSSLQIHANTHTGARPFQCPHPNCGREFNVNSNMRRHYRNHARNGNHHHPAVPHTLAPILNIPTARKSSQNTHTARYYDPPPSDYYDHDMESPQSTPTPSPPPQRSRTPPTVRYSSAYITTREDSTISTVLRPASYSS